MFIIKLLLKDTKSDCRTFLYGHNVLLHDFLNRIPYHIVDLPQNGYNLLIFFVIIFITRLSYSWYYCRLSLYNLTMVYSRLLFILLQYKIQDFPRRINLLLRRSLDQYNLILHDFPTWILYHIAELPYLDCKLVLQAGFS